MKSTRQIIPFFIFFFALHLNAQKTYKPLDTLPKTYLKKFLSGLEKRHNKDLNYIKSHFKGKQRRYLKEIYNSQYESLKEDFENGELYYNFSNSQYLKKIFAEILKDNPRYKKLKLYPEWSRSTIPNAYSVGDGTIIINLELLNSVENEDQLAFILAHELSHYILKHREKSYESFIKRITSKAYKQKEKEVFSNRWGRENRAEKLLKSEVYSRMHISRKDELEADSLGFILLANTPYNIKEAIRSLEIMDTVDKEKDSLSKNFLKKFFNTPHQKFNPEWFQQEDFSEYTYQDSDKRWNIDSLKTHPNCQNRILALNRIQNNKKLKAKSQNFSIDNKKFNELKNRAKYEKINNLFLKYEYGIGLYETLKLLQKEPQNKYLLKMTYKFIKKLSDAKKDMRLSSYVPTINPKNQTKSQQMFINFLFNLSENEWINLEKDFRKYK